MTSKLIHFSSLQNALFGHIQHLNTISNLHLKHSQAMTSQIVEPLALMEKREMEVVKKLAVWGKEIGGRWEAGSHAVEKVSLVDQVGAIADCDTIRPKTK